MAGRRGGDHHRVELGLLQHLAMVAESRAAELLGQGASRILAQVDHRHRPRFFRLSEGLGVGLSDRTGAHQAEAQTTIAHQAFSHSIPRDSRIAEAMPAM